MSIYLSPAQGVKELIDRLSESLADLKLMLRASRGQIRIDALYSIPFRNTPKVAKNEPIRIGTPDGDAAFDLACEVLTTIWLGAGQSARETLRAPGAIAVPGEILTRINESNRIRMELIDLLKPLSREVRRQIWINNSQVSSLQARRITPLLDDPLKIRFYWDIGESIDRYVVSDLIEQFTKELEALDDGAGSRELLDGSVDKRLRFSLDELSKLPRNERVAIRRVLPPHVRARVHDGDIPAYISTAPVPFVYNIANPAPPEIKHLQDYDPLDAPLQGKPSRRAKLMSEPYIEGLHLYRYLESARSSGPLVKEQTRNTRKRPTEGEDIELSS